ncbi:GGDEF domain-containing protein [Thermotoga petrophila]|nr:GGDEF domain-containing protein [Thermotoga petrophila]
MAAEGYDLEKLSDVSFSEEEIREWTKGECCSIRKIAALIDRELLDQDRYRKLVEHARFEEIRSNLCFVIDFKGKPMVLFNLDNFESEDAFNEVSLELVRLFATYTKILFERLKVEEELAEKTRLLEVFSYYDPLTGLPNRRLMEELSKKLLALAKREGKEIAVVFLDLSGFKKINDTFGHEAGDQILKEVSTRLKRVLRENDVIARFGGDEFVFIIYDCGKDCIETVLRRILNSLEKPLDIEGQKVQISGNFGVAFYPKDGEEFNNLLRKADFAMYLAKRNKEHVRFYEE